MELLEFVFNELLDDQRLITAEVDPDGDDIIRIRVDVGEVRVILGEGADERLEAERKLLASSEENSLSAEASSM